MNTWDTYFTPARLSQQLVDQLDHVRPTTILDICAGEGNLLRAAGSKWPNAHLLGNDLYRYAPKGFDIEWSRRDGRRLAHDLYCDGWAADLVVANPPFGRGRSIGELDARLSPETRRLLAFPRIEYGMTVASSLLVGPRGTLATLVPDSMVRGSAFQALREWLAERFAAFSVVVLDRQKFGRRDLGVSILIAHRVRPTKIQREFMEPSEFARKPRGSTERKFDEVVVVRGIVTSSELTSRGSVDVVHCGGSDARNAYELRRTTVAVAKKVPRQLWVRRGDLVVCRVGRNAGAASVYRRNEPAIASDCVLRVRAKVSAKQRTLQERVMDGTFRRLTMPMAHGLGARFVTKSDVQAIVENFMCE